ncbi:MULTISPECIES: hypothetical protein [unclassified Kitasatospora]|uniref:hypothetical protein n=1 Tax=unclassified Kitasatospora TaxID=2633591 RepID=UPI000A8A1DCB|nr:MULTISPECIES: hypothetical protein [unclassified Kitasatospora]
MSSRTASSTPAPRRASIGPALTAEQMPDGWTETVADDVPSQDRLVELPAAIAEAAT